ncbi:MAG TPA: ABC transporter ATP-binding protein, partial [Massilia sp.]|nr:ABC transporter ATP-binding protein [Massilia sp.]
MTTPILEIDKLHVAYGKVEALHGPSITVGAGQIVTVIGPNGA